MDNRLQVSATNEFSESSHPTGEQKRGKFSTNFKPKWTWLQQSRLPLCLMENDLIQAMETGNHLSK